MLIKYLSRKRKKEKVEEVNQLLIPNVRRSRAAGVRGLRVGGQGLPRPCPAAGHRSPRQLRMNPGGSRLVASRDRVATVHLHPPPSSEGGGHRRAARELWVPRRGAATGCPRDGSPRPRPLAAEAEKLRLPPTHPGELRGAAVLRGQPEQRRRGR